MQRRTFLGSSAAFLPQAAPTPPRLGIDLFSIRDSGYSAFEYLDYCAKLGVKVVHFSEIRFLGSLADDHLRRVRAAAQERGIELEIGMRSICPSSAEFDPKQGTAEEQIERMLHAAKVVGAPIVRAFLGSSRDRTGKLSIDAHIENAVATLRKSRNKVLDHGLKIAIENHAGDMQARELRTLLEEAGKDFVGVCLDSGNPMWAIEDPHLTLDVLHPYVLTSHIRDTAVWRTPEGAAVQWVRMGEGNINIAAYLDKYVKLCQGKAVSMEIIVTGVRSFPFLQPSFWDGYRKTPAWEFSRFLAHAENGKPRPPSPPVAKQNVAQKQREDLEASLRWTKKHFGT